MFLYIGDHNPRMKMAASGERPEYFIVREVYEQGAVEVFENELDRALDMETETIVIEPAQLGEETGRWIRVGNCLHKTAVLCGLGCFVAAAGTNNKISVLTLGFSSVFCAGVYTVSWQFDPCCKYQVETDMKKLGDIPLHKLASSSPIVLVRKDDTRRKVLHSTLAVGALALICWKMYKWNS